MTGRCRLPQLPPPPRPLRLLTPLTPHAPHPPPRSLPFLRTTSSLRTFNGALARCNHDLEEWRLRWGGPGEGACWGAVSRRGDATQVSACSGCRGRDWGLAQAGRAKHAAVGHV
jgi:hypothetical protein